MPQKTATMPQKTATMQQKTATMQDAAGINPPKAAGATHAPGDSITAGGKTYKVIRVLGSGGEGDIYAVSEGKRQYALKLCHPGIHTNTKVMPALQRLNGSGHIADIIAYGDDFELLEYIPQGCAASAGLKGDGVAILAIAAKTAMALDAMHKEGVIHKDIKPANILIKDRSNWTSALCDFGIADLLNERGTSITMQVRTPIYAAPEVYGNNNTIFEEGKTWCELTPKADFYSLGMTILSLWMGEGAFKAKEQELAFDKVKGRIAVPADMPDPLAKICRGLLIKNPAKRWDWPEIELTLDGKDVSVEEDRINEDLNITYNASRHQVANTPEELAGFMAQDPDLAKKYLYRGQIERWLKSYPELALEIQDIVEKRYPKDQDTGLMAAIYQLDPATPFHLEGISRESGEGIRSDALSLKDIGNFCNTAIAGPDTVRGIASDIFKEWVRIRDKAIADALPPSSKLTATFMVRVQTVDPMSDINLCNDPSDPDYAMTQEGIGRLFNKIYNIYWSKFGGDFDRLIDEWEMPEHAPLNRRIPLNTIINVINNFDSPEDYHYVTDFFDSKGTRFRQQRSWFVHCTDRNSDDYCKKAGPKDDAHRVQIAMMRVIKGYGVNPEYEFSDGSTAGSRDDVFKKGRKLLRSEWVDRGLKGFLCIFHQEDPNADLKPQFAYEKLLLDYVEDLRRIDTELSPVKRFDEARKDADDILAKGKARVRGLSARSVLQHILTVIFAILPGLLLLSMLVFSIIENPFIDMNGLNMEKLFWPIGIIVAAVIFFTTDSEGCLVPIIGGAIATAIIFFVVKLVGGIVLYLFAALVLAALVFFSIKTVFFKSSFARDARKFTKPGFDEKVLEPLYYAFGKDLVFDSSLNGAFNDQDIKYWKEDLNLRRTFILIFIAVIWFLAIFSIFIPKSERFGKYSAPIVEKVQARFPAKQKAEPYLDCSTLQQGDKGEDVKKLQEFLKDHGYLKGAADGDFGPGTVNAVKEFQRANGLSATGSANSRTLDKINSIVKKEI